VFHILNLLSPFSIRKPDKIQTKKAACCYPTGCAFGKSVKLFTAGYRTPVGFHPTGQHQFQVFLRLICLIIPIFNQVAELLSSLEQKYFLFSSPHRIFTQHGHSLSVFLQIIGRNH